MSKFKCRIRECFATGMSWQEYVDHMKNNHPGEKP